jgi:hypothetical protein
MDKIPDHSSSVGHSSAEFLLAVQLRFGKSNLELLSHVFATHRAALSVRSQRELKRGHGTIKVANMLLGWCTESNATFRFGPGADIEPPFAPTHILV